MPRPLHTLVVGLAAALLLAACSPSDATVESTTTSTAAPTTSQAEGTTTTLQDTTTTSAEPIVAVVVDGDLDADLAHAVADGLTTMQDPRFTGDRPLPEGLVAHVAPAAGRLAASYTASATTADLEGGDRVGVVRLGTGDVLLVADEGDGWAVVGADMPSVDTAPWFRRSEGR
jgi:hypothetical protein